MHHKKKCVLHRVRDKEYWYMRRFWVLSIVALLVFRWSGVSRAERILIPMDVRQTNHLQAYGVAYWMLQQGANVEWLLNYSGGSFLCPPSAELADTCVMRGVVFVRISEAEASTIYTRIEQENMEVILLEKAPSIAIYTPPNKQPWDDAVTLALTYAQIPYTTLWDEEVLGGELRHYDWVHLHHEDFTGQYGKFYASYHGALWYKQEQMVNETMARRLGFSKVSEEKKAVARAIKEYVVGGGFLFAMCSAAETLDIALAARNTDIVPAEFDGDPYDPDCQSRLDYDRALAFENFTVSLDPLAYSHGDIDTTPDRKSSRLGPKGDYFTLFDFSAKLDPVPTMLVQCHVPVIDGFMGQTTAFRKSLLKKYVTILAENEGENEVRYVHGNYGRGTFTLYGGHDPEDYQHFLYDPPTDLALHKNSPGYRLILNNILFPAARKKERKT